MSIPQQNPSIQLYSHPIFIGLVYAIIIRLLICPWDFDISAELIGFLGTDTLDTVALRWAFWHPDAHFFPVGWSAYSVTPNILDHLLFVPFLSFPFPLADNLWWLSHLWLSVVCAHLYGGTVSTNRFAGWMGGATLFLCDSLIRELNWGHAPQAMWWAPLCTFMALERWRQTDEKRWLIQSGVLLGISGWCYLYFMPFIGLISLPTWHKRWRDSMTWGLVGLLTVSVNLLWLYTQSPEMISIPPPPLINGQTLTTIHSATFSTFFSGIPVDISNQVSIIWMLVAFAGAYSLWSKDRQLFWVGTLSIAFGLCLIAGTNLPLMDLVNQVPLMSRLLWPERFGILIVVGMIVLVSSIPKARWLIPLAFMEFTYRSENLPLHTTSMEPWQCLTILDSQDHGAILELPLKDGDHLYNQQSLRQRIHRRPLVNPLILPPFVSPPIEWKAIQTLPSIQAMDGEIPLRETHSTELQSLGVRTILVDQILLSTHQQKQIIARLTPTLGPPIDLSCGYVWTIGDKPISDSNTHIKSNYTRPKVSSTQEPL